MLFCKYDWRCLSASPTQHRCQREMRDDMVDAAGAAAMGNETECALCTKTIGHICSLNRNRNVVRLWQVNLCPLDCFEYTFHMNCYCHIHCDSGSCRSHCTMLYEWTVDSGQWTRSNNKNKFIYRLTWFGFAVAPISGNVKYCILFWVRATSQSSVRTKPSTADYSLHTQTHSLSRGRTLLFIAFNKNKRKTSESKNETKQ